MKIRSVLLAIAVLLSSPLHAEEPPLDILDLASGAVVLSFKSQYNTTDWSALSLIDGTSATGWASGKGDTQTPHVFLIELAGPYNLTGFTIDNRSPDEGSYPGVSSRGFVLSASTEGPAGPFTPILTGEAAQNARKTFVVNGETARWLKLEVTSNWGNAEYFEIMELEATGTPVGEIPALTNVAGVYDTNYNLMLFEQKGNRVTGCYDWDTGEVSGQVEGRTIKFEWREHKTQVGTAIMVLAADGKTLNGLWYEAGVLHGIWQGTRAAPGKRPDCVAPKEEGLAENLKTGGRAVVYGILFDLDSATLRSESEPVLQDILNTLKTDGTLKLVIEGHTDNTGGAAYNSDLSQRRAASVVAWLTSNGIAADRLSAEGKGESTPVADNDTPQGRALNRRVELRVMP